MTAKQKTPNRTRSRAALKVPVSAKAKFKPAVKSTKTTTKGRVSKAKASATKTNPLHHHVKRIYRLTPKFLHGMVAGAFVGIMIVTGLKASGMVSALTISSPRDCDSNAVITCGALTTSELQTRYKN